MTEPTVPPTPADLFHRPPDRMIALDTDTGSAELALRSVGSGPDLLVVHGWPVSGATFRLVLPRLAEHFTCHVIDLPGTGSSRWSPTAPLSIELHIAAVRRVVDELGSDSLAVVGHDSGGMIARHAVAGDPRVRAMGLIDTEPARGASWRFHAFLAGARMPGFGRLLAVALPRPRIRRHPLVLGGAFVDRSLLDGEFDELFLAPLVAEPHRLAAALAILDSFDKRYLTELAALHRRIEVPVTLVWGESDPFFPVAAAEKMVGEFADARLVTVGNAALFSHEERPAEVAAALIEGLG